MYYLYSSWHYICLFILIQLNVVTSAVSCYDRSDCNRNQYCDSSTNYCRNRCLVRSDCPYNNYCDDSKVCKRAYGEGDTCGQNIECRSNVCSDQKCKRCSDEPDNCPSQRYCDNDIRDNGGWCMDKKHCKSNICISGKCAKCNADADCEPKNDYCYSDYCHKKVGYNEACDRKRQCKSNVCGTSTVNNICGCSAHSDCPDDKYCESSTKVCTKAYDNHKTCKRNEECRSNVCSDQKCKRCSDKPDNCPSQRYCYYNGYCYDKSDNGGWCNDKKHCKSTICDVPTRKCLRCNKDADCQPENHYCYSDYCYSKIVGYNEVCHSKRQCKSNVCRTLSGPKTCGCNVHNDCPKNHYCNASDTTCKECSDSDTTIMSCLKKCLEVPETCLDDHSCQCSVLNEMDYFKVNSKLIEYIEKVIIGVAQLVNPVQIQSVTPLEYWQSKLADPTVNFTLSDFANFTKDLKQRGCLDMAWSILFPTDYIIGTSMTSALNKSCTCSPCCTNYKKSNTTDQITCYRNLTYDHKDGTNPACPRQIVEECDQPITTTIPPRQWSQWANVSECQRKSNHPDSKCYRVEGRYRLPDNSRPNASETQEVIETECNEADHRECDLNCTLSVGRRMVNEEWCSTLKNGVPQCIMTMRKDIVVNATYNGSQCGETVTKFTCTTQGHSHNFCTESISRLQCFQVFTEETNKFCKTVCRGYPNDTKILTFADNEKCMMYHEYSNVNSSMCREQNCLNDCHYTRDNLVNTLVTSTFQLGNRQCQPSKKIIQYIKVLNYSIEGNDMTADPCPVNENYIRTTTVEEGKCIREATDVRTKRDACLSHWTAWSVCSESCNIGTRSRTMEIMHGGICAPVMDSEPCMISICANHLSRNLCLFLYFNLTQGDKVVTKRTKVSGDDDCTVQMSDKGFTGPKFSTRDNLVDTKDCEDVLSFSVNYSPIILNSILVTLIAVSLITARHLRQSAVATDVEGTPFEDFPVPEEIEATMESATPKLPTSEDQSETMSSRGIIKNSALSKSMEKLTSPPILSDPFKTESVTTLDLDPSTLSRHDSKSTDTGKTTETEEKTQKSKFTSLYPSIIKTTKTWKLDAIIDKTEGKSMVEQNSKHTITPKQISQTNEE